MVAPLALEVMAQEMIRLPFSLSILLTINIVIAAD